MEESSAVFRSTRAGKKVKSIEESSSVTKDPQLFCVPGQARRQRDADAWQEMLRWCAGAGSLLFVLAHFSAFAIPFANYPIMGKTAHNFAMTRAGSFLFFSFVFWCLRRRHEEGPSRETEMLLFCYFLVCMYNGTIECMNQILGAVMPMGDEVPVHFPMIIYGLFYSTVVGYMVLACLWLAPLFYFLTRDTGSIWTMKPPGFQFFYPKFIRHWYGGEVE